MVQKDKIFCNESGPRIFNCVWNRIQILINSSTIRNDRYTSYISYFQSAVHDIIFVNCIQMQYSLLKILKGHNSTITKNSHYKEFARFISKSFPLVSLQQIVSDPKCSVIFMRVICKLKTILSTFNCFSCSPISF